MTQGEAVFQAVVAVCGKVDGKYDPSKAQLEAIHELVLQMFQNGTTVHKGNPDVAALKKYIPGLTNNWLRKDKRLNGGVKYETKNPGSRSGSGDEAVKNMKILLSMTTDPAAKAEIQAHIDARLAELKPKVTIDISKLPESLRALVKQ